MSKGLLDTLTPKNIENLKRHVKEYMNRHEADGRSITEKDVDFILKDVNIKKEQNHKE